MSLADIAHPIARDETAALSPTGHFGSLSLNEESIMIYLTLMGSVMPMRVLESDSIAFVKLKIQNCKGFVANKQKLVCHGRELARNDSLVREYGVSEGNVLHLILRLSDLQAITVRTVCGKEFKFNVERCRNVGYLKQQIAEKGKAFADVKDQELICDGETLEDQRLIDDLCRNDDVIIHLLVRKSAKVSPRKFDKIFFELTIVAPKLNEKKKGEEVKPVVVDEGEVNPVVVDEGVKGWREESDDRKVVDRKPPDRVFQLEPIVVNPEIEVSSIIKDMIESTFVGLERGSQPIRSSEGSGGAYLMLNSSGDQYVSVFKPIDEEPMAVNNPRGLPLTADGEGLKKGTRVGEGAFREVAAYILDHPKGGHQSVSKQEIGFSGVPPTTMVKCLHGGFNHPEGYEHTAKNIKIGSLQMFMKNDGSCEDMGPVAFPVEEVHKISLLDIRLANADRHAGNILISKGEGGRISLIPIDHGYCLPENFTDCTFDWLYWPQARQPYSPDTIDYIRSLDAEKDIALMKFHGWDVPLECARTLRISNMLLKKGAERGLTPFIIGSILCRETLNSVSIIEKIVEEAEECVLPGTSEATFLEAVSLIMDHRLDEIPV